VQARPEFISRDELTATLVLEEEGDGEAPEDDA
jgi:hypothetical protein